MVPEDSYMHSFFKFTWIKKYRNIVNKFIRILESAFWWHGRIVAKFPYIFIFICLLITAFCSTGIAKFQVEERVFKLWIPQDSDFIRVMNWQRKNFPNQFRIQRVLYEAENVLDKEIILKILDVHEMVKNISVGNITWPSVCSKLPSMYSEDDEPTTNSLSNHFLSDSLNNDWSKLLKRKTYCKILQHLNQICTEKSILEIWGYNRKYIESLTQEQIIEDVNNKTESVVFGAPTNFSTYLGYIERDGHGRIVKARATGHTWFIRVNKKAIEEGNGIVDPGTGFEVDNYSYVWEEKFIKAILDFQARALNFNLYLFSTSSYGRIISGTVKDDTSFLVVGCFVLFIYVQIMLGRFNMVEQRPLLSVLGLCSVGLSTVTSYGLCSLLNVPFGQLNKILPFLFLGLGVDDMFVILQAWNNLSEEKQERQVFKRMSYALKYAGVSITVTSLTDLAAFAVGSTTVIPALRSFCTYASVGIAALYFFQATFFVAWFSIDQRRLESKRHGLLWCIKMEKWTPNQCSQRNFFKEFFGLFSKILMTLPFKLFVIALTLTVFAISCFGASNLHQKFDPIYLLPPDSYLFKFFIKDRHYFPLQGSRGAIYFSTNDFQADLPHFTFIENKLRKNKYIGEVDSWYAGYTEYWKGEEAKTNYTTTKERFQNQLSRYLYSPTGSKYRYYNIKFNDEIHCISAAPEISAFSIEYQHVSLHTSEELVSAMDSVKTIAHGVNLTGFAESWAPLYSGVEINQIMEKELYRNIGLTMAVIFLIVYILNSSLITSILVSSCVIITLIDVGAVIYWWGMSIDVVTCMYLILAVGFCVDYAAHIGHAFMTKIGTRNERAKLALTSIGPAVFSGGFSTFLAFITLANSESHVFITFFKVFLAVVIYGLYHGLVWLPVLLSLFGPEPYNDHEDESDSTSKLSNPKDSLYSSDDLHIYAIYGRIPRVKCHHHKKQHPLDNGMLTQFPSVNASFVNYM